jgi:hypothetical protein
MIQEGALKNLSQLLPARITAIFSTLLRAGFRITRKRQAYRWEIPLTAEAFSRRSANMLIRIQRLPATKQAY